MGAASVKHKHTHTHTYISVRKIGGKIFFDPYNFSFFYIKLKKIAKEIETKTIVCYLQL